MLNFSILVAFYLIYKAHQTANAPSDFQSDLINRFISKHIFAYPKIKKIFVKPSWEEKEKRDRQIFEATKADLKNDIEKSKIHELKKLSPLVKYYKLYGTAKSRSISNRIAAILFIPVVLPIVGLITFSFIQQAGSSAFLPPIFLIGLFILMGLTASIFIFATITWLINVIVYAFMKKRL